MRKAKIRKLLPGYGKNEDYVFRIYILYPVVLSLFIILLIAIITNKLSQQ